MSAAALTYAKKLIAAPDGSPITVQEKSVLMVLADSHNEDEKACWHSVLTIAEYSCIGSVSRVREILRGLIDKEVIWRDPRKRDNGSQQSNYWRFSALDGPPTEEAWRAEIAMRQAGRLHALKGKKSTKSTDGGYEIPQGGATESRGGGYDGPEGGATESRRGGYEIPQGGATKSRGGGYEISEPLNHQRTSIEPPLNLQGTASEIPEEPSSGGGFGNLRADLAGVWQRLLGELVVGGAIDESAFADLTVKSKQLAAREMAEGAVRIEVAVPDDGYAAMLQLHADALAVAAKAVGLDAGALTLEFHPERKASSN